MFEMMRVFEELVPAHDEPTDADRAPLDYR